MRQREPRRQRRGETRDRQQFLVFCGAARTESDYLIGLRAALQPACTLKLLRDGTDPLGLVQATMRYRDRYPGAYDETWVVFDVDHFEREGNKVTAALVAARKARINVAVSNPCFEIFLLLHHEKCQTHFADCRHVASRIKNHVPAYDKTQLKFSDFAAGVTDAVSRARDLDPTGVDFQRNPSTGVWRLVEQITENR